jgi:hypothetical protein
MLTTTLQTKPKQKCVMTQKSHQRIILIEKIELTTNPAPSQIKKKKLASLAPSKRKKP